MINKKFRRRLKWIFCRQKGKPEIVEAIKKISKLKYSRPRAIVEEEITQRSFIERSRYSNDSSSADKKIKTKALAGLFYCENFW